MRSDGPRLVLVTTRQNEELTAPQVRGIDLSQRVFLRARAFSLGRQRPMATRLVPALRKAPINGAILFCCGALAGSGLALLLLGVAHAF